MLKGDGNAVYWQENKIVKSNNLLLDCYS